MAHDDRKAEDVHVSDRPERSRYEISVDGAVAGFAAYRRDGDRVVFTHTEIDDAYEGQGLGSTLAGGALDDVRARGLRVVAECPFIRHYLEEHDEYAGLVAGADT
jgi:predicted GNAT family acetyltransferase